MTTTYSANGDPVTIKYKLDRLENPDEFLADDFDDEDIQAVVDLLAPACDEHRRRSFLWYYEMGVVVRDHYDDLAAKRNNMYGDRFFHRLARDLNKPDVGAHLLYNCCRLARVYEQDEYLQLSQHAALSPTHVLQVAGFEPDERDRLLQAVIANNWTTKDLSAEIMRQHGPRRQPGAGRPPKTYKKLQAAFVHYNTQVEKLLDLRNRSWFGDHYDIRVQLKDTPSSQLNEDFKSLVQRAVAQSKALEEAAKEDSKRMRESREEVKRCRKAQAEYNAKLAAEEELLKQEEQQ